MHLCGRLNYILRYNVRPFHDGCIRTQEVSSLHFTSLRFNSIQSAVVLTWILFILTIISTRVLASFHSYIQTERHTAAGRVERRKKKKREATQGEIPATKKFSLILLPNFCYFDLIEEQKFKLWI